MPLVKSTEHRWHLVLFMWRFLLLFGGHYNPFFPLSLLRTIKCSVWKYLSSFWGKGGSFFAEKGQVVWDDPLDRQTRPEHHSHPVITDQVHILPLFRLQLKTTGLQHRRPHSGLPNSRKIKIIPVDKARIETVWQLWSLSCGKARNILRWSWVLIWRERETFNPLTRAAQSKLIKSAVILF